LSSYHPHFFHLRFVIRVLSSAFLLCAFCHPHFFHPHFVIRVLSSAFCHPHFIIRHPPPSGPQFRETRVHECISSKIPVISPVNPETPCIHVGLTSEIAMLPLAVAQYLRIRRLKRLWDILRAILLSKCTCSEVSQSNSTLNVNQTCPSTYGPICNPLLMLASPCETAAYSLQ